MPVTFGNSAALVLLLLCVPVVWLASRSYRRLTDARRVLTTALRILGLCLLVCSVAALRSRRPTEDLATVFLLDQSASMSPTAQRKAHDFLTRAVRAAQPEDRFAMVAFGRDPIVARGWGFDQELGSLRVETDGGASDLAAAVNVGLAMLPDRRVGRLVLLSDGVETRGDASAMSGVVRWQDATVDVVPLAESGGADPAVLHVQAPPVVEPGARIPVRIELTSNDVQEVTLHVYRNGEFWREDVLTLIAGTTSRVYEDIAGQEGGAALYRVELNTTRDARPENNSGLGVVRIASPPQVWIVDGAGYGGALASILARRGLPAAVVSSAALPDAAAGYADVRAVVLNNVAAASLTEQQQHALAAAVREFGVGLVMLGTTKSFGPGGWLQTPVEDVLPVTMESTRPREGTVGIVLVLDVSGSMSEEVGGRLRLQYAQDAAFSAFDVAEPTTLMGVVAFSDSAEVVLPLDPRPPDLGGVARELRALRPLGGTAAAPGLRAAVRMLTNSNATTRHVIFMTDGQFADAGAVLELYPALRSSDITVSTVGAGPGVNALQLKEMAHACDGIFYPYTRAAALPAFFAQDTLQVVRDPVVEGPLVAVPRMPGAPVRGVDWTNAPLVEGMISTTLRESAQLFVSSPDQDPLVASWRVGLATSAVLCTDLVGPYAEPWSTWGDRDTLFESLVRSTLPPLTPAAFTADARLEGDEMVLTADAVDQHGAFLNGLQLEAVVQPPEGGAEAMPVRQVGPGQYEARVRVTGSGLFTAQVRDRSNVNGGRRWVSIARAYPGEYTPGADGSPLLMELAAATGGAVLQNPTQAFRRPAAPRTVTRDLWPWLTGIALCLFPLDVGLRRFTGVKSGGRRVPTLPPTSAQPAGVAPPRRRASQAAGVARAGAGAEPVVVTAAADTAQPAPDTEQAEEPRVDSSVAPPPQSTMGRLLDAKRKARDERDA